MNNKPQTFAGIGGLIGAAFSAASAFRQYDFSITQQMQEGVGYIVGGLAMGMLLGYLVGKLFSKS